MAVTGIIYVGTSGWSYPRGGGRWSGIFYPRGLAARDELQHYARYFNAVELNSSFYRPPSPGSARAWVERTPAAFRFTAKLWQKFTHPRMFEDATGQASEISENDFSLYLQGLEPLLTAGKLGPVLAQFPPSFRPDEGSQEYLDDLVRRLQKEGVKVAVEVRHRDWSDTDAGRALVARLRQEGCAFAAIDEPKFSSSIGRLPVESSLGYFRFHGRNWQEWWRPNAGEERYNYMYSPSEEHALASEVRDVAEKASETYAFHNNHYGAKAVVNALQLKSALGQPISPATLPEGMRAAYPHLDELLQATQSSHPTSEAELEPDP